MKKFFSLVCALAIVLSASAVPAKTLGKDLKIDAVKSAPAKTVKMANQLQKAERSVVFRAPQAKQETYNLTADSYAEKFYTSDNDVWVKLYVGDDYVFYFDVVVAAGTQELALDSVYDLASMLVNYSYLRDSNETKILYTAATLKKYTTTYEDQVLVNFLANVTDENGNVYTIAYNQAPFIISGDTTDVVFTQMMNKPIFAEGLCQLRTKTADNDIAFTFNVATDGSAAGTYAEEDMNLDYTFVNGMYAVSAHCVVTETANGHIDLEGWILATDGDVYHVTMFFDVPTAQSQETITATNLAIDDSYASWFGIVWADASNDDYAVSITFYGESASDILGTFALEDLYGIELIDANEDEIDLYSGSITVAQANGSYVITGTLLGMNNVQYTLNLSYVLPEADSQETIVAAGKLYLEEYNGQNYWQAAALNADGSRYVSLLAFGDGTGTYATSDLYAQYCYVGKFVGADTTWYDMLTANVVVAVAGEAATITGTLLGQSEDGTSVVEYTLNLTLQVVDEREGQGGGNTGSEYDSEEAFKHVFPEYTVDDQYLAQYNVFIIEAQDEDNSYISIEVNAAEGATELAAGVYAISDSYAANTVSAGSLSDYIYGSFAGFITSNNQISVPLWLFNAGSINIHENGVIEVNAVNTKGSVIECLLGQWPEGVENTEAEAVATKRIVNGQLVIEKNGVKYNAVGTVVK